MAIDVSDYPDVEERAMLLGCQVPSEIAILPTNFVNATVRRELMHASSAMTVRALLKEAGLKETRIEPAGVKFPSEHKKAADWIGPTIFFSALLLSQNPQAVEIALRIISDYLTDLFRGTMGSSKSTLDVVVKSPKGYRRIHYEGGHKGLSEVRETVREVLEHG